VAHCHKLDMSVCIVPTTPLGRNNRSSTYAPMERPFVFKRRAVAAGVAEKEDSLSLCGSSQRPCSSPQEVYIGRKTGIVVAGYAVSADNAAEFWDAASVAVANPRAMRSETRVQFAGIRSAKQCLIPSPVADGPLEYHNEIDGSSDTRQSGNRKSSSAPSSSSSRRSRGVRKSSSRKKLHSCYDDEKCSRYCQGDRHEVGAARLSPRASIPGSCSSFTAPKIGSNHALQALEKNSTSASCKRGKEEEESLLSTHSSDMDLSPLRSACNYEVSCMLRP
jgi:hypothetical protein